MEDKAKRPVDEKYVTNSANIETTPNTRNKKLQQYNDLLPYDKLPYDDPAVVNPQELASFPPPARKLDADDLENENEEHSVTLKKSPVREGRNIIKTDTTPGTDGFM